MTQTSFSQLQMMFRLEIVNLETAGKADKSQTELIGRLTFALVVCINQIIFS